MELLGKNLEEMQAFITEHGFPKFRAKQLMDYIYKRYIFDFKDMTQLPESMRQWLGENCKISIPQVVTEKTAPDGQTIKLLLRFEDNNQVETVLMKQHYGNSVCVSSQVGCAMGCIFCASTTGGLYRNLETHEIVGQVLLFGALLKERIHSIVVMGAGEPLQNYVNTIKALRFLHEKESFDIGYRRMTLSTCGIVENIYLLAEEGIPITLALSLHAPNDTIRREIMPIGAYYKLDDILAAVRTYYEKTDRRITFEYILIDGVNASVAQAHELGQLVKSFPNCNVNLIPVNGNEHIHLFKPSKRNTEAFKNIVASYGVSVTVRKEMGDAIQAACGQLKIQHAADVEKQTTEAEQPTGSSEE
ncbi:MAG: 23S rRNA (adenine(2503)-C(2))-methyltransferase RlmN [Veillonella sp.]|uniref:23S rRNA (adenine(2503)-C(2))-methyltransferase RlmN n=1 Tax=Veillonella sp. TaxID=1926307 RepID=UPI0025ED2052|nr:23S rRNA (adenine(2503)-C(2))-methyltransferase RlmN [Veillonella sp.]MBS4912710.1 23S rRNA (adenine(2503)-C(2))-methyltransferase RlmN [Veillonella sp.]